MYYINQRLLYPLNSWLMRVLKTPPMDGTFNQERPLSFRVCYSYDLTSATGGRYVYCTFFFTISFRSGPSYSTSAAVNSALTANIFTVPFVKTKQLAVAFAAGQPLGYLSSWRLFSLLHHFVIWLAAEENKCTLSLY